MRTTRDCKSHLGACTLARMSIRCQANFTFVEEKVFIGFSDLLRKIVQLAQAISVKLTIVRSILIDKPRTSLCTRHHQKTVENRMCLRFQNEGCFSICAMIRRPCLQKISKWAATIHTKHNWPDFYISREISMGYPQS
jgi:hypothetical protein